MHWPPRSRARAGGGGGYQASQVGDALVGKLFRIIQHRSKGLFEGVPGVTAPGQEATSPQRECSLRAFKFRPRRWLA